jgi:uncharacterized protein
MPHRTAAAQALIEPLLAAWAGRAAPRVAALHLPPRPWTGSKDGEFGAIELDCGALGLSYLLLDDALGSVAGAGPAVIGADAFELAREWVTPGASPARAALGFAAVNALTRSLFDRAGFVPPRAADSLGGLDPRPGEAIGMVGLFPPLLRQLVARGARLTVLELRADLASPLDGVTVTLDPAALAGCTQVLCTSTVLLNHSFERVRDAARSAGRFVLVGPGAGCLPDPLFERGVSALGGSWIVDAPAFKAALAEGRSWSGAAFKFLLDPARYPGVARLAGG